MVHSARNGFAQYGERRVMISWRPKDPAPCKLHGAITETLHGAVAELESAR
jgi:hypothetical protein